MKISSLRAAAVNTTAFIAFHCRQKGGSDFSFEHSSKTARASAGNDPISLQQSSLYQPGSGTLHLVLNECNRSPIYGPEVARRVNVVSGREGAPPGRSQEAKHLLRYCKSKHSKLRQLQ